MNEDKCSPTVVIVSSSNTKPKSLIKLITQSQIIDAGNDSGKISHPWIIDTKYYTANVCLCAITDSYIRDEEFNSNVEALIVHMDSNKDSGLADLQKWDSLENDCQPEVKLLVSNYCNSETKITKAQATEWCLKRGYELVELYPNADDIAEQEDEIIKEKIGVDRIIESLQTHVWPNLVMKEKTEPQENECGSSENEFATSEGLDDFTELFSQLQMMKESIHSMPAVHRKQCAEQMVTAFWKALGGDDEELVDI